jgi:iron complex transport system substrate-binding protein
VITGDLSTPATRAILKRAGYPLLELPSADNFAEIREQSRFLGELLGVDERAEQLIAEMDAELAALEETRPQYTVRVVAWDGSGAVPGRGTLFDEILSLAGGVNLAAAESSAFTVSFDMEELIAADPDILAHADSIFATPSLTHEPLTHPAIAELYRDRQITYPESQYVCGLPQSAKAARALREAMLAAIAAGPGQ